MTDRTSVRTSVRIGKEEEKEAKNGGNGAIVVISMLIALGASALIFLARQAKTDDFYTFGEYLLRVMQQPSYLVQLTAGVFVSGLALFSSSFFTSVVSLLNKRGLMKLGLGLMFVSAAFVLTGGGIILSFVGTLNGNVNEATVVSSEGEARELQDFSVAMYQKCCLDADFVDVNTAAVGRFSGIDADHLRYTDAALLCSSNAFLSLPSDEQLVEYCVGSYAHVQWFEVAVTDYVCSALNSTTVNIKGESVGPLDIEVLTKGVLDIPIASSAAEPVYGCGGGKVKSFQYINYLWFLSVTKPVGIAMVVVGVLSLLLTMMGIASLGLSSSTDMDLDMAVINAYMDQQHAAMQAEARLSRAVPAAAVARPQSAALSSAEELVVVSEVIDVDDKI